MPRSSGRNCSRVGWSRAALGGTDFFGAISPTHPSGVRNSGTPATGAAHSFVLNTGSNGEITRDNTNGMGGGTAYSNLAVILNLTIGGLGGTASNGQNAFGAPTFDDFIQAMPMLTESLVTANQASVIAGGAGADAMPDDNEVFAVPAPIP
jgi:hypothetical protein